MADPAGWSLREIRHGTGSAQEPGLSQVLHKWRGVYCRWPQVSAFRRSDVTFSLLTDTECVPTVCWLCWGRCDDKMSFLPSRHLVCRGRDRLKTRKCTLSQVCEGSDTCAGERSGGVAGRRKRSQGGRAVPRRQHWSRSQDRKDSQADPGSK